MAGGEVPMKPGLVFSKTMSNLESNYAFTNTDSNMPITIVDSSTSTCLSRAEALELEGVALGYVIKVAVVYETKIVNGRDVRPPKLKPNHTGVKKEH